MAVQGVNEQGKEVEEAHQLLNMSLMQGEALPNHRAYLDGCSIVMAFKTDKYLDNIRTVAKGIKINCSASAVAANKRGTYGCLKVWYIPNRIANIFSMHELEKQYRITYDSWVGYYLVHTPRGVVKFHKNEQGLPYIDLEGSLEDAATLLMMQAIKGQDAQECKTKTETMAHIQTVRANYKGFTRREVEQAKEARKAEAMLGNPSKKDYREMVSNHLVANFPVNNTNITNARQMFGTDLTSIRGKTVCRMLEPVVADRVAVPQSLMERIKIMTLAADVFFIDGTAFLITLSRKIKFVMAEHVSTRTATSLAKHLNQVIQVYRRTGFVVQTLLMDGEFEKIRDLMPMLECNTTAAKEHVSKAEHMIRMIKERTCGLITTLPFEHIP